MKMSIDDDILNPDEAAKFLKIPLDALLELSRNREIPCVPPKVLGLETDDFRYVQELLLDYMTNQAITYRSGED